MFTFCAAGLAVNGKVYSIEADIWLADLLQKSLQIRSNRTLNVSVIPCAVANENGIAKFVIAQKGRASNAMQTVGGRGQVGGARQIVHVPTLTLDTLLKRIDAPKFVKIDVEGAEVLVLKGAEMLLKEIRPVIYIEVGKETRNEVSSILLTNRYLLLDGKMVDAELDEPVGSCAYNTIAIPEEKFRPGSVAARAVVRE